MEHVRVWAEERGPSQVLLSWERPADSESQTALETDLATEARTIAATVGVLDGVLSATATDNGVVVDYDPEVTTKADIAASLRSALALEDDLKTRSNELLKRVPAYASLARSLALDERVSPVPEAARQAASRRGSPLPRVSGFPLPARLIPGLPLIAQLQTIVPILAALKDWSRDTSPEIVDEHLERAGLTRQMLDRDLATAHEAMAFARDFASEQASRVAEKAASAAGQARDAAREWLRQRNERAKAKDAAEG